MDEMVMQRLGTLATNHIMGVIEDCSFIDVQDLAEEDDHEAIDALFHDPVHGIKARKGLKLWYRGFPKKILVCFIALLLAYFFYFAKYCEDRDGNSISIPIYAPKNVYFNIFNSMMGTMQYEDTPIWTMPV